jgi:hypothetical protein
LPQGWRIKAFSDFTRRKIMRICQFLILISIFSIGISAQSRQQAIEKFNDLRNQAQIQERKILSPDAEDVEAAQRANVEVFRLLPREIYDKGYFTTRGGGAFYSFVKQSHSYDDTPQISLEQGYLQVGFYGAGYGVMTDLGETPLTEIADKSKKIDFLINYEPPTEGSKARAEYIKMRGFEQEGMTYKNRFPAIVGHSYILRAISYDEADTLVALQIHRKDTDGSLIIFWKLLKNYEKPLLARNK